MSNHMFRQLLTSVRESGYTIQNQEQLRSNRWLLTLADAGGRILLMLIQSRRIVTAADVQDLAELISLRRVSGGILYAPEGEFSTIARNTATEMRHVQLQLCKSIPPADTFEPQRMRFELVQS